MKVIALGLLIILSACGGTLEPSDAGEPDGALTDSGAEVNMEAASPDVADAPFVPDGGGCNTLVQSGPPVDIAQTTASPPTPQGGAVAAGVYALTAINEYGASTGTKAFGLRATLDIQGSEMQYVDDEPNQPTFRGTIGFTANGPSITEIQSCPAPTSATQSYTATASELRLQSPLGQNDILEYVYTRQ